MSTWSSVTLSALLQGGDKGVFTVMIHTYIGVCLVLFLGSFIQGLSGFGAVLISLPLLAFFLDIKVVIPLVALAAQSMALIQLIEMRRHFEWQAVLPLVVSALPGVVVGVFFLKRFDKGLIHLTLGIILIVYSLYRLFCQTDIKGIKNRWAYLFGFLGGCLGGAFGASGPPIILYTSLSSWSKTKKKVTLQGYFVLSGFVILFAHALVGLSTVTTAKLFGVSLPMIIFGGYVGSFYFGKLPEAGYHKVMLILLIALGIMMILRI